MGMRYFKNSKMLYSHSLFELAQGVCQPLGQALEEDSPPTTPRAAATKISEQQGLLLPSCRCPIPLPCVFPTLGYEVVAVIPAAPR